MNLDNKKHKKVISKMKRDIKFFQFKMNHKLLEKMKNEINRRGRISFCKGRIIAPYLIALGISVGSFSIFGATPFILDKRKSYEKTMKEIDASMNTRIISQYDAFETNENVITYYQKWKKNSDNTYSRDIKIYKLDDISENKIFELLNSDVSDIEELFGDPISTKLETRNILNSDELSKGGFLQARIYSEDEGNYIYVYQPITDNCKETVFWFFLFILFETFAFIYRGLSSFSYGNEVKRINRIYSKEDLDMLEKRLINLKRTYQVLSCANKKDNNLSVYLDEKINTKLSKLHNEELKDVLLLATMIELPLRKKLMYDELYTYGVEIELENVRENLVKGSLLKYESLEWILKKDSSLNKGIEIVSPLLYDKVECWKELSDVCESSKDVAFVDKNSSLHVHVGAHILGNDKKAWLNFIKLFSVYENIIFRFSYGEFYNYRNSIMDYASPVSPSLWDDYVCLKNKNADLKEILEAIDYGKYNSVNFDNVKYDVIDQIRAGNTIEIRCGNSTNNIGIIQNYVNFLLALFRYAKSDKFNDDLLDGRYEQCKGIYGNIDMYNEIYLDQALELCDLIFDNNLDKMYFLNQYLKDFMVDEKKFNKNKTFTKKIKK